MRYLTQELILSFQGLIQSPGGHLKLGEYLQQDQQQGMIPDTLSDVIVHVSTTLPSTSADPTYLPRTL